MAPARRVLLLTVLLLGSVLAGCTVPSGVNEDAYGRKAPGAEEPVPRTPMSDAQVFLDAMRVSARERDPLPDEAAYDAFLENATRWGKDGFTAWDANATLDFTRAEAQVAMGDLSELRVGAGSFKEIGARQPVRALHALRHGVFDADTNASALADALLDRASSEVASLNASVHAFRGDVPVPARDPLLRAEALLGVALTQLASAQETRQVEEAARSAAVTALDARFSAAAARWWLEDAEARAAQAPDAPRLVWPDDLPALTAANVAEAQAAAANGSRGVIPVQDVVAETRFGIELVETLAAAGLPEAAWAASQGLAENVLVIEILTRAEFPTPAEVDTAWRDAFANVRTFRDAQRFDVAYGTVDPADPERRFDAGSRVTEFTKAYAAVSLMAAISHTREATLTAGDAP